MIIIIIIIVIIIVDVVGIVFVNVIVKACEVYVISITQTNHPIYLTYVTN